MPRQPEFTALRYFTLDGSDYPSHAAQELAIARYIRWANSRATPSALGLPFTTWSLTKLADYLAAHYRLPVSTETIRRVLREAEISWQARKTWKASRDPDFAAKMARILELYDRSAAGQIHDGARVLCVDEFGPLNLLPRKGKA